MCRYRRLGQLLRPSRPWPGRRLYSEYAPAPPSPNDLKAPLPEKFSVGKNLKLKGVLFEYDMLAGSPSRDGGQAKSGHPCTAPSSESAARGKGEVFQPLSASGEKLVNEITGLLGKARKAAGFDSKRPLNEESLSDMGETLIADLKDKMTSGGSRSSAIRATSAPLSSPGRDVPQADPAAKYRDKIRLKTGGLSGTANKSSAPVGDGVLFAAKKQLAAESGAKSAWMLRQGAGNLLLYLAARSVRLGLIASPRTSSADFERFVQQLRQQSIQVRVAVTPDALQRDGVEAGVATAGGELGVYGVGSEILVVGSSEPILRAATDAEMFTARYHRRNTRREGVIQTFTVRDIDEVRTVVEQLNGVSFR